jgi:hypothetical protein
MVRFISIEDEKGVSAYGRYRQRGERDLNQAMGNTQRIPMDRDFATLSNTQ